jgi:hypothetical protein
MVSSNFYTDRRVPVAIEQLLDWQKLFICYLAIFRLAVALQLLSEKQLNPTTFL